MCCGGICSDQKRHTVQLKFKDAAFSFLQIPLPYLFDWAFSAFYLSKILNAVIRLCFLSESLLLHSFPPIIPFIYVAICDLPSFCFPTHFDPYSNLGSSCLSVLISIDNEVAPS